MVFVQTFDNLRHPLYAEVFIASVFVVLVHLRQGPPFCTEEAFHGLMPPDAGLGGNCRLSAKHDWAMCWRRRIKSSRVALSKYDVNPIDVLSTKASVNRECSWAPTMSMKFMRSKISLSNLYNKSLQGSAILLPEKRSYPEPLQTRVQEVFLDSFLMILHELFCLDISWTPAHRHTSWSHLKVCHISWPPAFLRSR